MTSDNRLVYSTEHGSLDHNKPDKQTGRKKSRNHRPQASSAPAIKNPNKPGVRIRREVKGRGGKCVCIISGLALSDSKLKALLKRLKGKLGTGGTMKNGCIEIQGEHREKLLALLEAEGHKAKLAGG